jgi:cysteine synthase B
MQATSLLDLVGNTPLVPLAKIACPVEHAGLNGVELWAKVEYMNPSGSIKDRAVRAMLLAAIADGRLSPGKTIIDATSGNSGIAYAMLGAALGFPVRLYLPANASTERKRLIKNYGAEIVETDPLESSDGAYRAAQQAAEEDGGKTLFYPDQYTNDANWQAHYNTTAPEIWEQSEHRVTHFVAAMGTSGTFVGTTRRLRELSPAIRAYAVQADSPFHGIEGTKHMASTIMPGIYDTRLPDAIIGVSTETAYAYARTLARKEGLFAGISSGANVAAAMELARTLPPGSFIVTVLPDSGTRYLSDTFWEAP